MPIYEYHCDDCGHEFEQMRRITDDTMPRCQACRSDNTHRLISLSAFHLKGSGWYVTDYGGKKDSSSGVNGNGNGADQSDSATSDSPDGKTDSADKKADTSDKKADTSDKKTESIESKEKKTTPSDSATK